ncbi:MAG: hypothetical protein Q4G68_03235 [Planctomycetia bacterium]|nr:hypothetical protein [Planctomycetia bacterium]
MKKFVWLTFCFVLACVSPLYAVDYYVDSVSGDDANNGTAPERAWKTLEKVNSQNFVDGDSVLFRRDGLWRGYLDLKPGKITYSSWGEGAKPRIYGSVALNREEDWVSGDDGLWLSREGVTFQGDVGNIILDGSKAAFKKWTRADLVNEDDFWFDITGDGRIHYKSQENPAKRYKEIEAAQRQHHVIDHSGTNGAIVDGFDLRYGAAHGCGGASARNLTIRNCDISWIGGGDQHGRGGEGRRVRFGNGIEFWDSAENCLVENNRIWEIYDAALTNQGSGKNREVNLIWRNNEIWNSEYSFEYWNRPEESITADILVQGNQCRDAGCGWGHVQRPDINGAHIMFYNNSATTTNFRIEGNTFTNSTEVLMRMENDWRAALTFEKNHWEQKEGLPWFRLFQKHYGQEGLEKLPTNDQP